MIKSPPQKYNPAEFEKNILKFWDENNIFQKSIDQRKGRKPYVFLEGPPTANGMPHPGHVLTRVMKDLVLRYEAMNGHYILRKAGWDTHGLPVEIEVEKQLGLEDKQGVEDFGIKKFNTSLKNQGNRKPKNQFSVLFEKILFLIHRRSNEMKKVIHPINAYLVLCKAKIFNLKNCLSL